MLSKVDISICRIAKRNSNEKKYLDVIVFVKDIDNALIFMEKHDFKVKKIFSFINAICINLDLDELHTLFKNKSVEYVASQSVITTQSYISKKIMNVDCFYDQNLFGKGINIAIIDTGVRNHIDFLYPQNRIILFKNFLNKDSLKILDDNGHGTFVAGLIASNGIASGKKYCGIAPKSNIIMLKALDKDGQSTSVEMLEAMQWIFDNKDNYKIDIVCMSFGANPTSRNDPLMKGAERLWDSGIVVVAAAGNSGPQRSTIKSPAISRKIITVGSMDDKRQDDNGFDSGNFQIAEFSSRGPAFDFLKPDLIVSGINLTSCGKDEDYTQMSGTSVSAPLVAGVCALIIEKFNRNITPNKVKNILQRNCIPLLRDRNSEGYGYLRF